jgi:hypothetical protein
MSSLIEMTIWEAGTPLQGLPQRRATLKAIYQRNGLKQIRAFAKPLKTFIKARGLFTICNLCKKFNKLLSLFI